jgi:hypothetical protein
MSKLAAATALLCLLSLSAPAVAFTPEQCKQHCAENCAGKGPYCQINCSTRCDRGGRH